MEFNVHVTDHIKLNLSATKESLQGITGRTSDLSNLIYPVQELGRYFSQSWSTQNNQEMWVDGEEGLACFDELSFSAVSITLKVAIFQIVTIQFSSYCPGDVVMIQPENVTSVVHKFMALLNLNPTATLLVSKNDPREFSNFFLNLENFSSMYIKA